MMPARIIEQIGVYKSCDKNYPIFNTPIPPINSGDTVVLKYLDGSTDVITMRANDLSAAPRCAFCEYGKHTESCPVHYQGDWYCIFDYGYAISVDRILEEL